jgi:putative SOS response-associated peptidase YedK
MCGRFSIHTPESRIREAFYLEHTEPLGLKPRYNIVPSRKIPIIRAKETSREMVLAQRGLVPHWSTEPKTRYSTINARIESVAEKPTYRTPFKRRRCLIPADGFYEWKQAAGNKVPYHIHMKNSEVFAFARRTPNPEVQRFVLNVCKKNRSFTISNTTSGLNLSHYSDDD